MRLTKPTEIAVLCALGFCGFGVGALIGIDAVRDPVQLPRAHDRTIAPTMTAVPPHDNHGYPDVIHMAPDSAAGPDAAPLTIMPSMTSQETASGWCAGFGTAVRMLKAGRRREFSGNHLH